MNTDAFPERETLKRLRRRKPARSIVPLKGLTLGERIADLVAAVMGSWSFIVAQNSGALPVDRDQCLQRQGLGPLSVHPAQSRAVVPGRLRRADHHDGAEPAGRHRPQEG